MGAQSCKAFLKGNKNNLQAGSILDRVISQASNRDQCLLYKLANYKKGNVIFQNTTCETLSYICNITNRRSLRIGGELLDAYNVGGQIEVEKLIREQFGVLMYGDGKGQIINRAEYLRWKFRDHEQVVLPIEASLSPHDPLAKWEDHEACWQMQYRGSLGETLLHVLIICDTKTHTKLARLLIKVFPRLAVDVVEGEEYLGASSLHLAIAYNNNELVQDLVEAGCNVNQRAIGSFFLPRDQQRPIPAKHTEYEGLAYLGEYPLAWAACCANESVYNLLLDSGAHPDLKDNFGNMILHMVVVCDKLDMFGYALRHPKLPASNGIVNNSGLTPLTLACKLGRAEVFREMLELSAKEFWRYSNITCSAYPLNALDTLLPDGRTNWNSALFIILNGTKEEHLDMLDGGIIQRLLEEKWKTFARNQFLKRLLILFIHLICLSAAVYLRPTNPDEPLYPDEWDVTDILRYVCEIGTLLGVLSYVVFQQGDEIRNQGLATFLKQQSHAPAKAIFLISNLLLLACIPCRLFNNQRAEEGILVFAVPGSWFLLMFFAGAVRLTGPFVTMIYSMITGDMLTFGIIYTVVLFGFSQSFYFLYKGFPGVSGTLYNSYATTWMALFQITMGDYNYADLANTTYPVVSKTVFALFMVFVPILLLNMLIAMMGNTYAYVIEQSEKEWMKQWAKIVVTLERAIPQNDAHKYLEEYSIGLGPANDDPSIEQRAVMIIKSKSKTRAKQRKGAVANWKRVGKVTITELKKRGMTGEELRCLMWGRESITTPVKVKKKTMDLANPEMPPSSEPNCFGALSSAVDVMAFTVDIDPEAAAQRANEPINEIPPPTIQKKPPVITDGTPTGSMFGALTQLADSQGLDRPGCGPFPNKIPTPIPQAPIMQPKPAASITPITTSAPPSVTNKQMLDSFVDPIRELVIQAQKKNSDSSKLQGFAHQAANIQNFEIIQPQKSEIQVTSLAGLFSGADNFVRKVEETVKKKSPLIDPSDSDSMENTILGRLSRTRRAISANIRNISARSKGSTKKLVCDSRSDSNSSLESPTNINYEPIKADDELDYAMERMTMIKESLKETIINKTEDTLKPVYNLNPQEQNQKEETSERISSSEEEIKKTKNSKKTRTRSKTAKTNRVTPAVDVSQRRSTSAEQKAENKDPESPPDPLQPWSVQGISNMNTILAWENEMNSE